MLVEQKLKFNSCLENLSLVQVRLGLNSEFQVHKVDFGTKYLTFQKIAGKLAERLQLKPL